MIFLLILNKDTNVFYDKNGDTIDVFNVLSPSDVWLFRKENKREFEACFRSRFWEKYQQKIIVKIHDWRPGVFERYEPYSNSLAYWNHKDQYTCYEDFLTMTCCNYCCYISEFLKEPGFRGNICYSCPRRLDEFKNSNIWPEFLEEGTK